MAIVKPNDKEIGAVLIVEYKGVRIPVYMDDYGQQYFIILNGKEYGLGVYNTDIEREVQCLYDRRK